MGTKFEVPPIESSLSLPLADFEPVEKRYFARYATKEGAVDDVGHPQLVLVHSNRLCLIALADKHPVIRDAKTIKRVNFQVSEKCNRLENVTRGKGKKGAQVAGENSLLAVIEADDGETYPVRSNVRGKIVEVNERLVKEPQLAATHPTTEGYIAMVLPKIPDGLKEVRDKLVCVDGDGEAAKEIEG